ncbi:hypothetical protein J6590_037761 [Homalodisca vitripennis]|nr:hypothetical protein J6590_037761 [Homalodisca vitripennis]
MTDAGKVRYSSTQISPTARRYQLIITVVEACIPSLSNRLLSGAIHAEAVMSVHHRSYVGNMAWYIIHPNCHLITWLPPIVWCNPCRGCDVGPSPKLRWQYGLVYHPNCHLITWLPPIVWCNPCRGCDVGPSPKLRWQYGLVYHPNCHLITWLPPIVWCNPCRGCDVGPSPKLRWQYGLVYHPNCHLITWLPPIVWCNPCRGCDVGPSPKLRWQYGLVYHPNCHLITWLQPIVWWNPCRGCDVGPSPKLRWQYGLVYHPNCHLITWLPPIVWWNPCRGCDVGPSPKLCWQYGLVYHPNCHLITWLPPIVWCNPCRGCDVGPSPKLRWQYGLVYHPNCHLITWLQPIVWWNPCRGCDVGPSPKLRWQYGLVYHPNCHLITWLPPIVWWNPCRGCDVGPSPKLCWQYGLVYHPNCHLITWLPPIVWWNPCRGCDINPAYLWISVGYVGNMACYIILAAIPSLGNRRIPYITAVFAMHLTRTYVGREACGVCGSYCNGSTARSDKGTLELLSTRESYPAHVKRCTVKGLYDKCTKHPAVLDYNFATPKFSGQSEPAGPESSWWSDYPKYDMQRGAKTTDEASCREESTGFQLLFGFLSVFLQPMVDSTRHLVVTDGELHVCSRGLASKHRLPLNRQCAMKPWRTPLRTLGGNGRRAACVLAGACIKTPTTTQQAMRNEAMADSSQNTWRQRTASCVCVGGGVGAWGLYQNTDHHSTDNAQFGSHKLWASTAPCKGDGWVLESSDPVTLSREGSGHCTTALSNKCANYTGYTVLGNYRTTPGAGSRKNAHLILRK